MQKLATRLITLGVQPKLLSWPKAPGHGDAADFDKSRKALHKLIQSCHRSATSKTSATNSASNVAHVADVSHLRQDSMRESSALLDAVYDFLGRFVAYPSDASHVAHTLWIAHAHMMDAWDSTPRIAFLSPQPASGKTRALEATELLVPRAVEAVNMSSAYLFRKVGSESGRPTILYDEIDTVFGPKAKDNEEIRGLLNAGHRKGAVAGRCVTHGKRVTTEELPAYCAVALAGLHDLPDTILSRCVVVRMRRRGPTESVEAFRHRDEVETGTDLRVELERWAESVEGAACEMRPKLPDSIADRNADIWEPLIVVAELAGGDWPKRALDSAVKLVDESRESTPSMNVKLLEDLRTIFDAANAQTLATDTLITELAALEESPWGDLYKGRGLDARGLARRLKEYGVKPKTIRIGQTTPRGYERSEFVDVWERYCPAVSASHERDETSATYETLSKFLDCQLVLDDDARAHERRLLDAYHYFAQDAGVQSVSNKVFRIELNETFLMVRRYKAKSGEYMWEGIHEPDYTYQHFYDECMAGKAEMPITTAYGLYKSWSASRGMTPEPIKKLHRWLQTNSNDGYR